MRSSSPSTFDLPTTVHGSLYTAKGRERAGGPWLDTLVGVATVVLMMAAPAVVLWTPVSELLNAVRDVHLSLGFVGFAVVVLGSMFSVLLACTLVLFFFGERVRIDGEGVHGARLVVRWSEVESIGTRSMVDGRDDTGCVTSESPYVLLRTKKGDEYVFARGYHDMGGLVEFCRAQLEKRGSAEDVPVALRRLRASTGAADPGPRATT